MASAPVSISTSAAVALAAIGLAGCGLSVQPADLFLLTRTGQGQTLTLLVRDDGTIRCNGRAGKPLSDQQLLQARDLQSALNSDAKAKLRIPAAADSVYSYTVKVPDGTISFADTAARAHKELAQAELLTVEVSGSLCR